MNKAVRRAFDMLYSAIVLVVLFCVLMAMAAGLFANWLTSTI